jgi:osmotically inducible lipoprotein OsmB
MPRLILATVVLAAATLGIGGCASQTEPRKVGTVGGAVAGGAIGSAAGGGTLGTLGGAAAGGYIGDKAGEAYDKKNH